jgi:hypothetical protein
MFIANPIYDVVFKYLMEDNKVAKLLISAIIGENVLDLEFCPQERTIETEAIAPSLTVYRLDFSAKIETSDGYKSVMIEMQKAKTATDIMRFRRYLGGKYQDKENIQTDANGLPHARQIYCIFFLGYDLGFSDASLLEVDARVYDRMTGKEFDASGEFIEGLHHRSWIIQISHLKSRRRNDLERLLSIFDQDKVRENGYILSLPDEDIPAAYDPIIRRLRKAAETPEMRDQMEMEDDYIEPYRILERINAKQGKAIEERDKALDEQAKTLDEQAKAIEEKNREIEALKRLLGKG